MHRLGVAAMVRAHDKQGVDRPELIADNFGKRRKALIMRSAINSLVRAAATKHGRERMFPGACAVTADDTGSGHASPDLFRKWASVGPRNGHMPQAALGGSVANTWRQRQP